MEFMYRVALPVLFIIGIQYRQRPPEGCSRVYIPNVCHAYRYRFTDAGDGGMAYENFFVMQKAFRVIWIGPVHCRIHCKGGLPKCPVPKEHAFKMFVQHAVKAGEACMEI